MTPNIQQTFFNSISLLTFILAYVHIQYIYWPKNCINALYTPLDTTYKLSQGPPVTSFTKVMSKNYFYQLPVKFVPKCN